ncbi:MAG: hypothetical protein KatS3mg110_1498 [Pirellulaceae bacterium]|nr:MAG: hypothetical protein KatS3mg110_1498 [Pirellulaceae bacterium]
MARKVVNRKALREEVEAAERAAETKAKTTKSSSSRRKTRTKEPVEVRVKLYWGVFNQMLKRVALYEYHQKKEAEQKAEALTASTKIPHFVRKIKEEVTEKA